MRYAQFFTATILNWQKLIARDDFKDIIIQALHHRVQSKKLQVYGFVIMPNHIHIIWFIDPAIKKEDFQRNFLKYTAKSMIDVLKTEQDIDTLETHYVAAKDRLIQIWERNALSIDIYSLETFNQKLRYIHNNPYRKNGSLQLIRMTTNIVRQNFTKLELMILKCLKIILLYVERRLTGCGLLVRRPTTAVKPLYAFSNH